MKSLISSVQQQQEGRREAWHKDSIGPLLREMVYPHLAQPRASSKSIYNPVGGWQEPSVTGSLDGALSLKPSLEDYLPAQGSDPAAMMVIVWMLEKEGHSGKHVPP